MTQGSKVVKGLKGLKGSSDIRGQGNQEEESHSGRRYRNNDNGGRYSKILRSRWPK